MKILANENVPRGAVEALRRNGHDVLWARTDMPGTDDIAVLSRARAESRLVVTFDKDFGELAYRLGMAASCGVVLFRFVLSSPESVADRSVTVLNSRDDWQGHFAVVDDYRVRLRPLPEM